MTSQGPARRPGHLRPALPRGCAAGMNAGKKPIASSSGRGVARVSPPLHEMKWVVRADVLDPCRGSAAVVGRRGWGLDFFATRSSRCDMTWLGWLHIVLCRAEHEYAVVISYFF